jgi:hypothetical protein
MFLHDRNNSFGVVAPLCTVIPQIKYHSQCRQDLEHL